jgi:hypothetical protein
MKAKLVGGPLDGKEVAVKRGDVQINLPVSVEYKVTPADTALRNAAARLHGNHSAGVPAYTIESYLLQSEQGDDAVYVYGGHSDERAA